MQTQTDIFAYGLTETESIPSYADLMNTLNQPPYRAKQLAQWLWVHGVNTYDDMVNLPASLRTQLTEVAPLHRATAQRVQHSTDATRKYLLRFTGNTHVEAVGLPGTNNRLTVCVSAQAGCALACTFCATGRGGLIRNLLPGEIAEQVRIVGADFNQRISNVVVMGQGEPFQNYNATLAALRIINTSENTGGLDIGARHITVSTSGIISGIKRFSTEPEQFTLAVSLHSAVQTTRNKLMPGLKSQPLDQLKHALRHYCQTAKRRPSLEYALIKNVNDSKAEIAALTEFARGTGAHINLIPLNESTTSDHSTNSKQPALQPATQQATTTIAEILRSHGIETTVRKRRGADIAAACGQLATESQRQSNYTS